MSTANSGPLSGVRVLDLTQMLAGPYSTMLLADLGADVIKIEPPDGDETRRQGPFPPDDELHAYGGYFQSVNRNKRGIVLDLKTDTGKDLLLRLADTADVLVENFRVGVMDRLGLSYETLHRRNPRLVYAAIRGFGDPRTGSSPYQEWPAFDVVAQAMGGLMGVTGPDPESPMKAGPGVGDLFPATLSTVGVLAALWHARMRGEGQFVDVAMFDGVLSLCERIVYQHSYTGETPRPQGNSHPLLCPFGLFPAEDGWVTIAAPRDHQWRLLCGLIGRQELAEDPRYATNALRVTHQAEVYAVVSRWTSRRPVAEVTGVLGGQVPIGPVNTADTLARDPHVAARRMRVEVAHPGAATPATIAGTPIKFTATDPGRPRSAPLLGEHTEAVLAEIGVVPGRDDA